MSDSFLAKVDKNEIEKNIDTEKDKLVSTAELIKNNLRKIQLLFAVGFEARPTKNDKLFVIPFGNSKRNLVAVGGEGQDVPYPPLLNDGERRISSTNSDGTQLVASIYLDNTGRIIITTDDRLKLSSKENVEIDADNNVEIDADNFIILQSGSDFAVRFSAIEALMNEITNNVNGFTQNTYNIHTHVTQGYTSSAPTPTTGLVDFDPAPAKIDNIKVP